MGIPILNMTPQPNLGASVAQGIGGGLQKLLENRREQKLREQQLGGLAPLFEELGVDKDKATALIKSGLDPALAVQALGHVQKANAKKSEDGLSNEEYTGILDQLQNQIETGEAGQLAYAKSFLPSFLGGGEARRSTAKFQSSAMPLLGLAQKIALKSGIRNQREFDAFMERTIPNESDDADTALGKIEALRSYLHKGGTGPFEPAKSTEKKSKTKQESKSETVRMRDPSTGEIYPVPKNKVDFYRKQGAQAIQ